MVINKINKRLKRHLASLHQPQPESGFTLMELLMAILVGGMITYGMLALVVSLLGTEKQETAKSQVQQEMNQALDYIASEIQQAVFIYNQDKFPPLAKLNLGDKVQPVIAFWKATPIKVQDLALPPDSNPCANHPSPDCRLVLRNLQTYNLVIYGVRENKPDEIWQEGAARIIRYEMKQYSDFATLTETPEYRSPPVAPSVIPVRPSSGDEFREWEPVANINWGNAGKSSAVLVDGLDYQGVNAPQCPDPDYKLAMPPNPTTNPLNDSFYACARSFSSEVSQDAILFLRGNAATRAGQPDSRNTGYLPSFERRVQALTVLNRRPPSR
ncbi:prepilin-type N-terminal cleavage/methylation domain-containing protein [Phormidium pseudopriestleyi FRX01]|uniref:Prepilin-type N-terminal cleavage/methylation domain-containing protein n=1 Tax=Phormidium pseudopriestleyi FRX01 TaxID=1759528 RepID=A0ABS3FW35_9CYAN|nr:prepilin-type N-terminal cleavage/methylation domain-containing protein [Phormidium pseudopriestleyi]MBO0350993.1 prepilin-type N-terminal cleavage/methylation domain-containing protein [Phormidium pseudopriestleyi FRX01]